MHQQAAHSEDVHEEAQAWADQGDLHDEEDEQQG
jgi:hypothetical protein